MEISFRVLSLCSLFVQHLLVAQASAYDHTTNNAQTYIVHVKSPPTARASASSSESINVRSWHRSFLPVATDASTSSTRMIYSYRNTISGFAARLTESELKAVEAKDGFVQAYPDRTVTVRTTHSPAFLGLTREPGSFWNVSGFGAGVIIGVVDTGILPSHPSFSGQGMPPPPARWKGACEFDASECNNKLIGARVFVKGSLGSMISPSDEAGHGTHTASTAAGSFVGGASVLGTALGTAVGMAPMAHLAMYKVCSDDEHCSLSDVLAGMDAAIADGVDVISVSLGLDSTTPFFRDPIAVGALAAVRRGIFVSCAAGNAGPDASSLTNDAPWITTVGASTTDRWIAATLKLGNGGKFVGKSLFQSDEPAAVLPIVYPGSLGPSPAFCSNTSFDGIDVKGKMVVCDAGGGVGRVDKGVNVLKAGGLAMVLANAEPAAFSTLADAHKLPSVHVSFSDASMIKAYINETANATAMIVPEGTLFGRGPAAPTVAHFSSRGPSLISPGILKPDIVGPGVDVLAAWPLLPVGPSPAGSSFNIVSGTSMSTPHLSGIASLLKGANPNWSPAMIRSAIMTTADTADTAGGPIADQTLEPASAFAVGAGHVSPARASRPGLVYDIGPDDYVGYMCGLPLTDEQVSVVAGRGVNCSAVRKIFGAELNYPSFSVTLGPGNNFSRTVARTVTNVGRPSSGYAAKVVQPPGATVTVTPAKLEFAAAADKSVATYSVEFTARSGKNGESAYSEGSLTWFSSEELIAVRSPIVIAFQ